MFINSESGPLFEPLTGRHWDKSEVSRQILGRTGQYQKLGLKPKARAFILYGNRLEFFVDLMAIWNLGACAVPLDARLMPNEVETLAKAAKPKIAVDCEGDDAAKHKALKKQGVKVVESPQEPGPTANVTIQDFGLDEDALILFTSGTTGNPKGVVHTHRSLRARWLSLKSELGVERFARTLCLLPTHFGHGLICNALYPWLSGQALYIVPPFKPDIIMRLGKILDDHEITFMSSVPSVWRLALKTSKKPEKKTLQSVFCGSAPLSAHLWKGIQEWTGTGSVLNTYGITETGSWVAGPNTEVIEPHDGLVGRPWGAQIKIMKKSKTDTSISRNEECSPGEEGFIWLNTPALMKGYLDRDDLTREVVRQGWFMTGDIGVIDEKGLLILKGRIREEINKGGMKVQPADIDAVVERFKGVMDVCSFGYDDPLYGQNVGIAVVVKDKDPEIVQGLFRWVKENLAEHKRPQRWYVLEAIPRTSRGKINRDKVAEACKGCEPVNPTRDMPHPQ